MVLASGELLRLNAHLMSLSKPSHGCYAMCVLQTIMPNRTTPSPKAWSASELNGHVCWTLRSHCHPLMG